MKRLASDKASGYSRTPRNMVTPQDAAMFRLPQGDTGA